MRIALTIAGSDSGGAAGIQADLKTFHQFGVFGTTAITAVTAQNTLGVAAWQAVPAALVAQQLDALAADLRPAAVQSGMLGSGEIVETVAQRIAQHRLTTYVLDPVMVATSGDRLLERDAEELIARRLTPLALLVTPNLNEAEILVAETVRTPDQMEKAGRRLLAMDPRPRVPRLKVSSLRIPPVGGLDHENVVRGRPQHASHRRSEPEIADRFVVLAALGPHEIQRRAGHVFPAQHGIAPQ